MKRFYYLLAIAILMASTFAIYNSRHANTEPISSKALTPEEIWQKEYQKKKAKRKKGYCKSDKPDMYTKYFEAITTEIGKSKSGYPMNYKTLELKKALNNRSRLKSAKTAYSFVQRGPANVGGRTRAIVVDPDDPNKNTWYAGSATGGIWKTTDAGDNWTDLSEELSNLSVNALAMANSNHDILYAGTGESFPGGSRNHGNGIWKSEDRGDSWTQLANTANDNNFTYINRLFVDPADANIVIAATEKGILKSVNGGLDWTKVYTSQNGVEDLASYPSARDTIYAGEHSIGIIRSIDGGDTWQLFSNGLDVGKRHELAVSPVDRNCVFTSVHFTDERSEVYFSNDNANNWTKFDDDQNFLGGQGRYDNIIEAHPFIDSVVFVGGVDLWKVTFNKTDPTKVFIGQKENVSDAYSEYGGSNNYGQSFGFGTTKIPGLHPDHHNLTMIPSDDGENFRIVNGNDGGVAVSEDNGLTFTQKPNNYITTQFYGVAKHPTTNEYIGGMQDNGTWQSKSSEDASSASNYYFRIGGDGFECLWHPNDPKKILGSVYYNDIRRSTDGGQSWSSVEGITEEDGPFITRLSYSPRNPDVVFAVGTNGVYKSTDFGANWSMKTISSSLWARVVTSQHNVEVSLANPNIVWAGSMLNPLEMIHVSKDEGETFTAVSEYADRSMNVSISGIATHPSEDSTAYVLFSLSKSPKILRTKDLGATWEDISGFGTGEQSTNGFPDVITHCLLVMPHEPSTLWAGTEIGLFESTDDGTSWHAVDANLPPVSVYDMHIVGEQVVMATHGRGIWSVDIPEISYVPVIDEVVEVQDKTLDINMNVKADYQKIEIYLDGNLHQTIASPEQGQQSLSLSVDQAGVYNTHIIAYLNDKAYQSNTEEFEVLDKIPSVNSFELDGETVLNLEVEIPVAYDQMEIYLNDEIYQTVDHPNTGTANYEINIDESSLYKTYVVGYLFDSPFQSNTMELNVIVTDVETIVDKTTDFKLYPNPCRDEFKLQLPSNTKEFGIEIFDLNGRKLYHEKTQNKGVNTIRIESLKSGLYIVRVTSNGKVYSRKIQVL